MNKQLDDPFIWRAILAASVFGSFSVRNLSTYKKKADKSSSNNEGMQPASELRNRRVISTQ